MSVVSAPCKDCEKRKIGCHSTCMDYLKYQGELYELKEQQQKYMWIARDVRENVNRMKRKRK